MAAAHLLVLALLCLRHHGVLGRSAPASHGANGVALQPVLMTKASGANKAGGDIMHLAAYETISRLPIEGEYYYYGTVARINAWDLSLKPGRMSSVGMWLEGDGGNQIMAGFQVSPDIYNDTNLHFFVSWTADGYNSTGCFNTQCEGFVSSTPAASISPGSTVAQPSVYHGNQTDFTITILKDPDAGSWTLYVDASGTKEQVGYFPASLFTGLADHAAAVGWGGSVWSSASLGAAPPMGSGHGPDEGFGGTAAYIASIALLDFGGSPSAPAEADLTSMTDAKECYNTTSVFVVNKHDGAFFYYGGPGCDH
ncbi:hypothetical protein ACP70R_005129 [Stipagrostis hirtigluma subsp. patula]